MGKPPILKDCVDAQAMAAASTDGLFQVPTDAELDAIAPGRCIKICRLNERFWIEVRHIEDDGTFLGVVANHLVSNPDLPLRTLVRVERRHIYTIM